MRKTLLYVLSSIGLLGAIVLGVFSLFYDNADAAQPQVIVSPDELDHQEETSLPSPIIVHQAGNPTEPKIEDPNSVPAANLLDPTTSDAETDYDVLATVEQLSERYSQSLLVDAPGWVLIKAERYLANSNIPLANGALLPDRYIEETWFNVNAEGQIVESLNRSLAENGNLLRQNYVNDTQEANKTTESALDFVTLDYGALVRVRIGLEYGSEVKGWIEIEDGVEKYIVTLTDYYDSPVQFAGQLEKTNSLQVRLSFDVDSGRFLSGETLHQYENGELMIVESIILQGIQLIPSTSLPAEIQQALPQN